MHAGDYRYSVLGKTGIKVCRMGLSGTYRPGRETVHHAREKGIDLFFCYGFDTQMIGALREMLRNERDGIVIVTGAYNLLCGHLNLRRTLEKRLRRLKTDYIDVFLFLGVTKPSHCPPELIEEMQRFKEEGKARAIGVSCHDRRFVGQLALDGAIDVVMMRYNAAHRGAEEEVFPFLEAHNPGLISYTATRWRRLLRRPRGWPREKPVPSAAQCYRFVLSRPEVNVCLTAPSNIRHLEENLRALDQGPLSPDEDAFMREFGDAVHSAHGNLR
ncbi:MAG TPA: aldo/keto reductase [Acidobacteriota bacterium]|nr:aldo/keto reductase [Acidobacteriota bacterium]